MKGNRDVEGDRVKDWVGHCVFAISNPTGLSTVQPITRFGRTSSIIAHISSSSVTEM
jgi:hypothetical protein